MKFTTQQKHLARELTTAKAVADKTTTVPILATVRIAAAGDRVTLQAANHDVNIKSKVAAEVIEPGAICLSAKRLADYVQLLPDGPVKISTKDSWATIEAGRAKARVAGLPVDDFPGAPQVPSGSASLPAPMLVKLIERTRFGITDIESRFTINGALLSIDGDGAVMVSTDGHCLCYAAAAIEQPAIRCIVPTKALDLAAKLLSDGTAEVSTDEGHVFFSTGAYVLTARRAVGNFPDYERVLPRDYPYSAIADGTALRGAIDRVSRFSDEQSHAVDVEMRQGTIGISAQLSDVGGSDDAVTAEVNGATCKVRLNAKYLLDFLRMCPGSVRLEYKNASSAVVLRPDGDDSYLYVVMPMR